MSGPVLMPPVKQPTKLQYQTGLERARIQREQIALDIRGKQADLAEISLVIADMEQKEKDAE